MSKELLLVVNSSNLAVFAVFLIYLMMIQWAAKLDLRLFQLAALSFVIMSLGEIVFAANQLGVASEMYAWFGSEENLALFHDGLYLLAGALIGVWQYGYLQELKGQ